MMRFQFLISLSLLSQTAVAFQTAPITFDRTTSTSTTALENNHSPHPGKQIVLLLPKNRKSSSSKQQNQNQTKRNNNNNNNNRLFLSKLKLIELSALTQLKKDERNNFNKRQLLKLGITTTSALFVTLSKSRIARAAAATPLLVSKGGAAITPLIVSGGAASIKGAAAVAPALVSVSSSSAPGLGIAKLPGMCRISPYEVGRLPNEGAMFFALALFVATGLMRSAGGGYARLMHFMFKCTGLGVDDDDSKKKEDIELGLAQESDWGAYSHDRLDPLQPQKKNVNAEKVKDFVLNPYTMLFERTKIKNSETEEAKKLQQASKHFQDQKYKQHHHPVHVARTEYEQNSYLGSLAINDETKHDMPKGYLDTLSNAKSSTWDVYKHQLDGAKPVNEVDELKQDLTDLQTLLQEEQSMYQTSNQALKLAMEAQSEEHHHSTTKEELKDFDEKLSTNEELKAFDKKAREFEEITVVEVESKEKKVEKAAE